ncbi:MAG: bifunctional diaminohydroxyphosphoribosylaminopyrimidine deaminase/5-amino-6-(5-phosphoribosylamino)uracil reductase RibD [Kiritimatiellae bacterium]|nr:bifunctional diaminohydroxyphosphoribosylaminopyrimidine deaminase/5-amino-6-(5-phosphoribosylamino)uracil reductase RibD [Kiritimatiellia bacterium]
MARAAKLASRGLGHTRPNPAVGAVIVKDGRIVGEGWHKRAGGDHAEVAAIKNALGKMKSARTACPRPRSDDSRPLTDTAIYVTLEPCSRPGRVGACTDAIASAGISRVVYAVPDPNPANRGKAKRALARHGIVCELFKGDRDVSAMCRSLIADFRKHVTTGLPYVTVKLAMSLDGRICDDWGDSNWITCEASRDRTNELRSAVDAIMVGAETVRRDDPSLLSRIHPNNDLIRVVVSRSGKLPKKAQVFTDGRNKTLVFDDAVKAIEELGRMGVMSVLCEGGLQLARSLADAGLVDEWLTVMAPVYIGSRRISRAIRGTAFYDGCFLSSGDSFYRTGLSDFANWSGDGVKIKFDAKGNPKD